MRAQMEVLGLVVIIVLFVFGGLIYLMISSKPPDTSLAETRQSSEISNLLTSMLKVTPCESLPDDSLADIINSCYLFGGSSDYCGNPSCKDYIKDSVRSMVRAYDSGLQYSFDVKAGTSSFISDGSCTLPKRMAADTVMPFGTTSLKVSLVACVK